MCSHTHTQNINPHTHTHTYRDYLDKYTWKFCELCFEQQYEQNVAMLVMMWSANNIYDRDVHQHLANKLRRIHHCINVEFKTKEEEEDEEEEQNKVEFKATGFVLRLASGGGQDSLAVSTPALSLPV